MNRRGLLARAIAVGSTCGLIGCLGLTDTTVPVVVGVINNRAETHTVALEVADGDETVLTQHLEVIPSTQAARDGESYSPALTVDDLVVAGEEYWMTVDVVDGDSRTERVVANCSDEGAIHGWTGRLESNGGIRIHDGCLEEDETGGV
ncbi:hypothetical protein [Natronosalvus vescus]|uniref:hypothetical protein n=1 Tax=Natronosalvus vescus TaxID=2953881 RepID=UPI002091A445|nr:hypothetical protein [Natronosalvus vescus]